MFDRFMSSTQKPVILCVVHIFTFILLTVASIGEQNGDNYGAYIIDWETFEKCKGPKQDDCGEFEVTNLQNMSDLIFLLDFHKDCPATMGKIVVSTRSKNVTKRLWNYVLSKPCEHFVLGPILMNSFNLTKECKIYKGKYEIHLDLEAKTKVFLGENFFYGNYTFQITSYNKAEWNDNILNGISKDLQRFPIHGRDKFFNIKNIQVIRTYTPENILFSITRSGIFSSHLSGTKGDLYSSKKIICQIGLQITKRDFR